ncbi:MAG: hypothetical protein ACERKD_04670 [Prolixibacteraceae bacterium]
MPTLNLLKSGLFFYVIALCCSLNANAIKSGTIRNDSLINVQTPESLLNIENKPDSIPEAGKYLNTNFFSPINKQPFLKNKSSFQKNTNKTEIEAVTNKTTYLKSAFSISANLQTDSLILVNFYNTLKGKSWIKNENWLKGNLSSWYGITVDSKLQRVTAIDLRENKLSGNLSDSLFIHRLSYLTILDLGNMPDQLLNGIETQEDYGGEESNVRPWFWNNISGSLPLFFDSLSNLKYLDISYNLLNSSLPETINGLEKLEYIYLNDNSFTGAIPDSWQRLTQLKTLHLEFNLITGLSASMYKQSELTALYLDHNKLSEPIPPLWGFFPKLDTLSLSLNQLDDPLAAELYQLPLLSYLNLSSNLLDDPLPAEWSNFENLTTLDLSSNLLDDPLPPEWGKMQLLATLNLSYNKLTDLLPAEWGDMPSLATLNLRYNSLDKLLPGDWGKLNTLKWLNISNNLLDDPLPAEWSGMTALKFLDLSYNKLSDPLPAEWESMASLLELYLENNLLDDDLPASYRNLKSLKILYLNFNQLNNPLPPEWSELDSLEILLLNDNNLGDPLPAEWGNMNSIRAISLQNNKLDDQIPEEWGDMTSLEFLNLRNNLLDDPLPASWGKLSNLRTLDISFNKLDDQLPNEWSGMVRLEYLNLSQNQLNHALPNEWKAMKSLQFLDFSNNQLDDELPGEWYGMKNLTYLNLSHNLLDDPLPANWEQFPQLQILLLDYNKLDDPLPDSWKNLPNLLFLELDHNLLADPLPFWGGNSSLNVIDLSNNLLDDVLTDDFGGISRLTHLILNNNSIVGSLPDTWNKFSDLVYLDLTNNKLTGVLPPSWGNMQWLSELYLKNNSIQSEIPSEWGALKKIIALDFDKNSLYGEIPNEIGNCRNLHYLNLNENNISGSIPLSMAGIQVYRFDITNNNVSYLPSFNYTRYTDFTESSVNYHNHYFFPYNYFYVPGCYYSSHYIDDFQYRYPLSFDRPVLEKGFKVANNKLEFDDLERNVELMTSMGGFSNSNVEYIPQDTIYREFDTLFVSGRNEQLTIPCGGSNNYYEWQKENIQIAVPDKDNIVFTNIQPYNAGTYHSLVTNKIIPDLVLISYPVHISTISKTDISCYRADDGILTFSFYDAESNQYQYSIDNGASWHQSSIFGGLNSGDYHTIAWRNNTTQIQAPIPIRIFEPDKLTINNINIQQAKCPGDSAYLIIDATGGNGQYLFGKDDSLIGKSNFLSIYEPNGGEFSFFVQDENGCIAQSDPQIIDKVDPIVFQSPAITYVNEHMGQSGGIEVHASGNNLQYSIDYGETWQSNSTFSNLTGGFYDVWALDKNDCIVERNVCVPIIPPPIDLIIVDGGFDSRLVFKGIETTDENRLRIYTNWGATEMIDVKNYSNSFSFEALPAGTYFYRLDYTVDSVDYFIKSYIEVIKKY